MILLIKNILHIKYNDDDKKNMNRTLRNVLSVSIAVLPINIIMIWYRLTQTENFSTTDMTVYPLIFGGGTIILIFLLK